MRLAGYGFVVAAPEIYHRIEPAGTVLGFDDEGKARGQRDAEATPVADFDADMRAALDWTGGRDASAERLGATGHCTGGHLAFRAAFDPRVRATACWYPTGLHDGKLAAEADAGSLARAGEISGELLMIFGTRDPHTPEAGRDGRSSAGSRHTGVDLAGACSTPSTPSGVTSGPATTPRPPTPPSRRRWRCCARRVRSTSDGRASRADQTRGYGRLTRTKHQREDPSCLTEASAAARAAYRRRFA